MGIARTKRDVEEQEMRYGVGTMIRFWILVRPPEAAGSRHGKSAIRTLRRMEGLFQWESVSGKLLSP